MTHMKLTDENLKSILEVLEIEDDGTDPDSFDRLCAMAVRDAIDMTARIAELTADLELFTTLADKQERYADAMYVGLNQVIVASMMTSDTNALADIARNALKDG